MKLNLISTITSIFCFFIIGVAMAVWIINELKKSYRIYKRYTEKIIEDLCEYWILFILNEDEQREDQIIELLINSCPADVAPPEKDRIYLAIGELTGIGLIERQQGMNHNVYFI